MYLRLLTKYYLLLLIGFSFSVSAQDNLATGYTLIGGGFNIGLSEDRNESSQNTSIRASTQIGISPYFGKMYNEENMAGLFLTISHDDQSSNLNQSISAVGDVQNRSVGLGVFHRRFLKVSDRFGVFVQSDLGYERATVVEIDFPNGAVSDRSFLDQSRHSIYLNTGLGIYYFVTSSFALETRVRLGSLEWQKSEFSVEVTNEGNPLTTKQERTSESIDLVVLRTLAFDQFLTINFYF
ncbi:MAG: hypothetical protein ACI8QD_002393 [Cyclobacteriaceae bacterium]